MKMFEKVVHVPTHKIYGMDFRIKLCSGHRLALFNITVESSTQSSLRYLTIIDKNQCMEARSSDTI